MVLLWLSRDYKRKSQNSAIKYVLKTWQILIVYFYLETFIRPDVKLLIIAVICACLSTSSCRVCICSSFLFKFISWSWITESIVEIYGRKKIFFKRIEVNNNNGEEFTWNFCYQVTTKHWTVVQLESHQVRLFPYAPSNSADTRTYILFQWRMTFLREYKNSLLN